VPNERREQRRLWNDIDLKPLFLCEENAMTDRKKPVPPAGQPDTVPLDIPDTEPTERELPEGQLPGMPVWRDPLLNPGPTPAERERSPLD